MQFFLKKRYLLKKIARVEKNSTFFCFMQFSLKDFDMRWRISHFACKKLYAMIAWCMGYLIYRLSKVAQVLAAPLMWVEFDHVIISLSIENAELWMKHPLSVFRPEGSAEEQKRFRWDFGSAENLPVRLHLDSLSRWKTWPHWKDSGEILYFSGGSQWLPECHRKLKSLWKLFCWRNKASGGF